MINFFSKYRFIFYILNFFLVLLYLFPGSLLGFFLYDDLQLQPQITRNFLISSNHFYAFLSLSIIGYLTFLDSGRLKILYIYLVFLSIILEVLHIFIPVRSFELTDLFGNLLGVLITIIINFFFRKYEKFKK